MKLVAAALIVSCPVLAAAEIRRHPGSAEALPHDQYVRVVSEADSPVQHSYVKTKDGLYVAAAIRKPRGDGPFPAIIVFHGAPGGRGMEQLVGWSRGATGGPVWERFLQEGLAMVAVMPTQYITGHEQLLTTLTQAADLLRSHGLQVSHEMKAGNPAASINAVSAEIQADLIVLGARGLRATLGILLGGVAKQVVETAHCPVLVVREPYRGIRRLLLVTVGSESSMKAADYLARSPGEGQPRRFPLPEGVEIQLMHVLPPSIPSEVTLRAWSMGPEALYPPPLPAIEIKTLEEQENRAGEQLLEATQRTLKRGGLTARTILKRGDAATEIQV